ncbi:MAG: ATP-binding protein [Ignavibacteriaceae bacterium]|nr:ATP-binding protein [Ignavibacteriaceae bacterium]
MKNEKFYSEFLSGLANQPDQTTSAKLIGEKIHFQLQTAVEMFISLKDDHLQIIFSQSVTTFSESELQQLLSKNEFPQEQESSTENVRSLCEILQAEHVFYLPFQIQTGEKFALLIGRNSMPFSDDEKEYAVHSTELFISSAKIIQSLELNKAIETQLIQKQKFETLGKLTSGIAHDFSNLLSSIFGSVNLLKKKVSLNHDALRLVENIESCSVRAKDLTSGLLAYGKPKPKQKEILSPNQLVNEIAGVVKQTFPASINFPVQLSDDVYELKGNSTQIYQVLLNLCINARDAVGKQGSISLSTKNVSVLKNNTHRFPFLPVGNFVCFSVKDSGCGISEENLSKIFDPYFTTKEKESSSGLGLYISYGIIKAHGGVIQVSSKLNEGTCFEIYLPAYEVFSTVDKKISEKIIVLADDEEMLQDLLSELLESNDFYVIKMPNGKDLIQVLGEIKADLAIIDYNMPEMNGLECIAQIRKLGLTIPIILSSGSRGFADKKGFDDLMIDAIVNKPYDFDTMLATVKKLL